MSLTLVVQSEVDNDLREAVSWYEEQELGLGQKFLNETLDAIERLRRNPYLYYVRHRSRQVRWSYTRRFPYRIVFSVIGNTVVVYAVIHGSRHDRHWKSRIEEFDFQN